MMRKNCRPLLLLLILLSGCSHRKSFRSQYQKHTDYEGQYEYTGPPSLTLAVSDFDTILYAIIDDAQYPLKYTGIDTFQNPAREPVIFQRDKKGNVIGYQAGGEAFRRLGDIIENRTWFPRKELYNNASQYKYTIPAELGDGLQTGDVKDVFTHPEVLITMVQETIEGAYRDVHSILIWKDGKLVVEEYFYGYSQDKPHQMRSASKSFIGTLVGIAIDQGKINDEHALLLPFFAKEYTAFANTDSRKNKITIQDFLTYRHGMD